MANPITGSTLLYDPAISPSGTGYEANTNWLGNGNLFKAGDNWWMAYVVWQSLSAPCHIRVSFATVPVTDFPGTFAHSDLPPAPADQDTYMDVTSSPCVVYDPVVGEWHLYAVTLLNGDIISCYWGHWKHSGTATTFPSTGWTEVSPRVTSLDPSVITSIVSSTGGMYTIALVPKAGGGWIAYGNSSAGSGSLLYLTADTLDSSWTPGTALYTGNYGAGTYPEYFVYFVYNGNYYWIQNIQNTTSADGHASAWTEKLYSCSTQTGTLNLESSSPTAIKYLTSLAGYSANSGLIYGAANSANYPAVAYSTWPNMGYTIGNSWPSIFSFATTPISSPEPVLSNLSTSGSGGTLTITGTATPGDGGALWEVGLYNSHTGARSKATWGSWGEDSPGTVANTFSGTIAASEGDEIYVTAYNVAMESDTEIIIAVENRVDINKGQSTIIIM